MKGIDTFEAERLAEQIFKESDRRQESRKQRRLCSYFLISCGLQALCALIVLLALLWATIQFLRVFGVLGITSQEPPGLTYVDAI